MPWSRSGDGTGCVNHYAVSIAGIAPARHLTWFQAAAAARNSGKRLAANVEWQAAALGTPDGSPCNNAGGPPGDLTGASASCVSNVGVFDMVGNLSEWVADWVPLNGVACGPSFVGFDFNCPGGLIAETGAGALLRGGNFSDVGGAGPFAVGGLPPTFESNSLGFRAAR
jgi:formylglycine-generating enzyme required for sulfatase activity